MCKYSILFGVTAGSQPGKTHELFFQKKFMLHSALSSDEMRSDEMKWDGG